MLSIGWMGRTRGLEIGATVATGKLSVMTELNAKDELQTYLQGAARC